MGNIKNNYTILEEVDFFDLMQNYRIAYQGNQENVIKRFTDVKEFIKDNFVPKEDLSQLSKEHEEMKAMLESFINKKKNYIHPALWGEIEQLLTKINQ